MSELFSGELDDLDYRPKLPTKVIDLTYIDDVPSIAEVDWEMQDAMTVVFSEQPKP